MGRIDFILNFTNYLRQNYRFPTSPNTGNNLNQIRLIIRPNSFDIFAAYYVFHKKKLYVIRLNFNIFVQIQTKITSHWQIKNAMSSDLRKKIPLFYVLLRTQKNQYFNLVLVSIFESGARYGSRTRSCSVHSRVCSPFHQSRHADINIEGGQPKSKNILPVPKAFETMSPKGGFLYLPSSRLTSRRTGSSRRFTSPDTPWSSWAS